MVSYDKHYNLNSTLFILLLNYQFAAASSCFIMRALSLIPISCELKFSFISYFFIFLISLKFYIIFIGNVHHCS